MIKRLIAVQGPLQVITGLIAMEWHGKVNSTDVGETVLLLFDPCVPSEQESAFSESVARLASLKGLNAYVFIDSARMSWIGRRKYSSSIREFKKMVGEHFDEVYLPRDFGGFGNPLILNAYPNSMHVMYGDAFGIVGNECIYYVPLLQQLKSPRTLIKSILRQVLLGGPDKYSFDCAVLLLPLDWSGHYLDDISLLVPNREFVRQVITEISQKLVDLNEYCQGVTADTSKDYYLCLLSNLCNSGAMSIASEVDLYADVIRQTARRDTVILLKPHPRSGSAITTLLTQKLQDEYIVKVLDDPTFSLIPIELWSWLIERCSVISVYSASALNLLYIYDKKCTSPLAAINIEKYFFRQKIQDIVKGNNMFLEAMNLLETWDRKSPLWKGH